MARFAGPLECIDTTTPTPQGTEVLLRVTACGICHSDLHIQDGFFDLGDGQRVDLSRGLACPLVLGHEIAGKVVAAGPAAQGVAVGDRRVAYPWIGCGGCGLCAAGEEHLCAAPRALGVNRPGGFADHLLVPHPRYLLPHEGVPASQACTLACSGLTAFSALRKLAPLAAEGGLLIIGAGGVGLSAIRLARKVLGAAPIVVEIDRGKWAAAEQAGAAELIDPSEAGALKALLRRSGGVAAAADFVGAGSSFDFAFGALRKGGRMVVVGLLGGATRLAPAMLALKAVTVAGSYVGSLDEFAQLLALARDLPPLPVEPLPLEAAPVGLERLRRGGVVGRLVLTP